MAGELREERFTVLDQPRPLLYLHQPENSTMFYCDIEVHQRWKKENLQNPVTLWQG